MHCPYCDTSDTRVIETRETHSFGTRRRRECHSCKQRFTTYERIMNELVVVKKDNRKEQFDTSKVITGMMKACQKRAITEEVILKHAKRIHSKLLKQGGEVPSKKIGQLVMQSLKKIDHVAYIRFASVYKSFDKPDQFAEVVRRLR